MAQEEFEHAVKRDAEARVREGVKVILEEVLQKEMTEHLKASYRERNGRYTRNLLMPAGEIERLEVPREWGLEFATEVLERYKHFTGTIEEALRERHLSRISPLRSLGPPML